MGSEKQYVRDDRGRPEAIVAVDNVCAWPNLTLLPDGTIAAIIFNQPNHGRSAGDVECWASTDGRTWRKRASPARHKTPRTTRMNVAAGTAGNGDLLVICSGWSDEPRAGQTAWGSGPFRAAILDPWVCRSTDGGQTWAVDERAFPPKAPDGGICIPFGDILPGADGALRAAIYSIAQGNQERVYIYRSPDDGKTWGEPAIVDADHTGNETALMHLGGGSWLAAVRWDGLTLYASDDDARTWRRRMTLTGKSRHPGHLLRLRDGRILLTHGNRAGDDKGIDASVSGDEGKTWTGPFRVADWQGDGGYPSSVQLSDDRVVTAFYAQRTDGHARYHMGTVSWDPARSLGRPSGPATRPSMGEPMLPVEFRRAGILDTWKKYEGTLTWGQGQALAALDDGCDLTAPQWRVKLPWGPKMVAGYDSIDLDDDPTPVPPGYHGTSIAYPSSQNYEGKLGVAFNNGVVQVRAVSIVHLRKDESQSMARGLQWVIDHHRKYNITAVNLSPLDDQEHAEPIPTAIDEKLRRLRELGVWVSAPCGNNGFTGGISWPACQPDCFAIGAVKPEADVPHLDRGAGTDLVVPAAATSSSNAIAAASAMIVREAIDKARFDWRREAASLPAAMMAIFRKTGKETPDPATGLTFRRLDLLAAVDYVFARRGKEPQ